MAEVKFEWKALEGKSVLVYGGGTLARFVVKMLIKKNIRVVGMAVTSLTSENAQKCDDIAIKKLEDWSDHFGKAVVLVATSKYYHNEIKEYCESHGFKEFVFLDSELLYESLRCYFSDKEVSLDNSYFTMGNGNYINPIVNPLVSKTQFENIFVSCIGDFVIPSVYNDFSMIYEGPYELGEVAVSNGDIVLDLGANLGVFSVYAAAKGGTAYAFEPTGALGNVIKFHSEVNGGAIHYEPYAVSDKVGEAKFLMHPLTVSGNTLVNDMLDRYDQNIDYETVKQTTIDDFVKTEGLERVDFIKADIEGAERLMLKGAQETLKKFAPKLALCTYHLPDDKEVMTELILKANPNYKIEYKWDKLFAYVD